MTGGQRASIFSFLRAYTAAAESRHQPDSELLARFADQRDEAAFAALVARHGPMVLGVCRRILRHSHDAEDAFQATFLVLARKAAAVRWRDSVAGWLYQTAHHLALRARAADARRRSHESRAQPAPRATQTDEITLREFQQTLDDELARLPEKYRLPLVLCCLEGASRDEAAQRLGWSLQTLKDRLEQARELLRKRLARRGVTLAAALASVTLAEGTASAIPAPLATSTVTAALLFAAGQSVPATASAAVLLATGTLRTATLKKLVLALALSLAAALGSGGILLACRTPPEPVPGSQVAEAGKHPGRPAVGPVKEAAPVPAQRIVFAGDSSTDGNTYLLLVRQALARAGRPVPGCINAGVSNDMASGVRQRLQRDVLVHKPTLVVLSVGIHDAILDKTGRPAADYEADVRAIAADLGASEVPLVLMTTGLLGREFAWAEPRLAEYNAVLHRLAGELNYRVADANLLLRQARSRGQVVVEGDNVNPNFEGQRLMARAVLDALGHADVVVPKELAVSLLPGVVKEWQVRLAPAGQTPLTERLVADLEPQSAGWTRHTLPEKGPASTWWLEHERQRGFVLSLDRVLGRPKASQVYQGLAYLQADRAKRAFLHTGGHLDSVWLNGQHVYKSRGWTGWHPGKERVPVRLLRGRNVLVIEGGSDFFLSVTEDAALPQERPQPPPASPN
jgi:RNA polymerase sigma factor (sigma-70 family)